MRYRKSLELWVCQRGRQIDHLAIHLHLDQSLNRDATFPLFGFGRIFLSFLPLSNTFCLCTHLILYLSSLFVCLVGFLTSSSTTRLYRGRAPRQECLTILRAATHETELGDHDLSQPVYLSRLGTLLNPS